LLGSHPRGAPRANRHRTAMDSRMDRRTLAAYQPLLAAWASHVHVVPVRRIRQKAHVGPPHPRPAPHHPALRRDARRSTVRVILAIAHELAATPPNREPARERLDAPWHPGERFGQASTGRASGPTFDSMARAGLLRRYWERSRSPALARSLGSSDKWVLSANPTPDSRKWSLDL